jgi:hypothetical protein
MITPASSSGLRGGAVLTACPGTMDHDTIELCQSPSARGEPMSPLQDLSRRNNVKNLSNWLILTLGRGKN